MLRVRQLHLAGPQGAILLRARQCRLVCLPGSNDEAIFKVDLTHGEGVLSMWCKRLFRTNISNVAKVPFYFHFGAANTASTVSVSLSATTSADRQHFA